MEPTHEENAKKFFEENPPFEKIELPTRQFNGSYTIDSKKIFPEDYCDIARRDYFYYNASKYVDINKRQVGKLPRGTKNWKAFEMSEMVDCDPRYFNQGVELAIKEIIDIEDNDFIESILNGDFK